MKLSFLRPTLLLAMALGLTACGGKATFDLSGPVVGLEQAGLVLHNTKNGDEVAVAAGATTWKLAKNVEYGDEYVVAVKSQPAHQDCKIAQGADTAGRLATISIEVVCSVNAMPIGGAISGLNSEGLVLINGTGDRLEVKSGATEYEFVKPVAFGRSYGVTVLTQPKGLHCVVANGVGQMADVAVKNINVSCALG